jgi:SAM-dependent methyltransferase
MPANEFEKFLQRKNKNVYPCKFENPVDFSFVRPNEKLRYLPRFLKRLIVDHLTFNFLKFASYKVKPDETILDAGAGDCILKEFFKHAKYISCDLKLAKREYKYSKIDILCDLSELSKHIKKVDNIICWAVLEHCKEPDSVIKEFSKVLNKRGNLFLYVPFIHPIHQEPDDYFRFTKYGIKYLLEKNRFKVGFIVPRGGGFRVFISNLTYISNLMPKFLKYPFYVLLVIPLMIITSKLDYFDKEKLQNLGYLVYAKKM